MTMHGRQVGRREFLVNLGKGTVGLVVFGLAAAACADDDAVATTLGGSITTGPPTTTVSPTTSDRAPN